MFQPSILKQHQAPKLCCDPESGLLSLSQSVSLNLLRQKLIECIYDICSPFFPFLRDSSPGACPCITQRITTLIISPTTRSTRSPLSKNHL